MADIFAIASRKKFRFSTPQGHLTVEDLWDIPLSSTRTNTANLDAIAIGINRELKSTDDTVSFVNETSIKNEDLRTKFDVVLEVIKIKKEENVAALEASKNRALKQRLLEIKSKRQDESLETLTEEELDARIAAL